MMTSKVTKIVSRRRAWRERQRQGLLRSWQPGGAHHERFRSGEADADTLRKRALDDRRGTLFCTVHRNSETCTIRHSTAGRVDQYDIFNAAGRCLATTRLDQVLRTIAEIHA